MYVSVHVRTPKVGERTQFHTLGLGKNPRTHWVFVKSGIAGRAYKAAALPIELRQRRTGGRVPCPDRDTKDNFGIGVLVGPIQVCPGLRPLSCHPGSPPSLQTLQKFQEPNGLP